jgi:uncharacterized membrane protein YtjA (UPF0391 family)
MEVERHLHLSPGLGRSLRGRDAASTQRGVTRARSPGTIADGGEVAGALGFTGISAAGRIAKILLPCSFLFFLVLLGLAILAGQALF